MQQTQKALERFVKQLPKAELHIHLEGSISADRLASQGKKYSTNLADLTAEEIQDQLFSYRDFLHFLEAFRVVCTHLRSPEDYAELFDDLVQEFRSQNVQYAEVIYTPSIPWKFERDGEEVLEVLVERTQECEASGGPKIRWILDCVRQFGPEAARRTAELASSYRSKGVVAIGLGGDENALPAEDFQEVFQWARANALFAHIHAGEVGEPSQIWDALLVLGANRIGHGIQAARDPRLMDYLKQHTIGLDVCLTSNVLTGAWRPLSDNPFWLLHKRGVPVTLNTDDPGLFRTTLNQEYLKAAEAFRLGPSQLAQLALQAVRSSFLPYEDKMELMQKFQDEIHSLLSES